MMSLKARRWSSSVIALAMLCAAVMSGATAIAAPESERVRASQSSPTGSWSGTVYRPGVTEQNRMSFASDGRVCLVTNGGGRGTGTWRATGTDRFNYQVREKLYDQNGNYFGYVDINQDAVQANQQFRSQGVSKVYDANGNYLGPNEATVKAKRDSERPFRC